jgi:exodeoxyribonuclease VII small subunit
MSKRPQGAGADAAEAQSLSFEAALARLEALAGQLESGELSLEDALTTFEQGVALSRRCAEELARAERRLEHLVQGRDGDARERFEPEPAEEA